MHTASRQKRRRKKSMPSMMSLPAVLVTFCKIEQLHLHLRVEIYRGYWKGQRSGNHQLPSAATAKWCAVGAGVACKPVSGDSPSLEKGRTSTSTAPSTSATTKPTTSTTASITSHFGKSRINLLLGLGQNRDKVTSLSRASANVKGTKLSVKPVWHLQRLD